MAVGVAANATPYEILFQMFSELRPQLTTGGTTALFRTLMRVVPMDIAPSAVLNAYHEVSVATLWLTPWLPVLASIVRPWLTLQIHADGVRRLGGRVRPGVLCQVSAAPLWLLCGSHFSELTLERG